MRIHQRDDADLDAQGQLDQPGDAIEGLLAAGIERVVAVERGEPVAVRGGLEHVVIEKCLPHRAADPVACDIVIVSRGLSGR